MEACVSHDKRLGESPRANTHGGFNEAQSVAGILRCLCPQEPLAVLAILQTDASGSAITRREPCKKYKLPHWEDAPVSQRSVLAANFYQTRGVKMDHEMITMTESEMMEIVVRCSDSDKESAYQNGFYVLTHHEIMKVVNELAKIFNHKNP